MTTGNALTKSFFSGDFVQLGFGAGLVFTDDAPVACVPFRVQDDNVKESVESFTLTFQLPIGVQFMPGINGNMATIAIIDDDSKYIAIPPQELTY